MTIEVARYNSERLGDWRQVLVNAKNAIFQFDRGFIEYHGDRFVDMSAISYIDGRPVAVIPAAFDPASGKITSHPGLTFGGPVFLRDLRGDAAIEIVGEMLNAFREWGGTSCLMKLLPQAFASYPAAEADYALWQRGFSLVRRDLSSLLPLDNALPFNESKRQAIKKARKHGVVVSSVTLDRFHSLLEAVLLEQHGVKPVHSKAELSLLQGRFPENILIRAANVDDQLLAATLVFNYGHVWHTQYLASSAEGRGLGALDLVIAEVIREAIEAKAAYLSFGTSTEAQGRELNCGLLWQKESYGARALVHDFLEGTL